MSFDEFDFELRHYGPEDSIPPIQTASDLRELLESASQEPEQSDEQAQALWDAAKFVEALMINQALAIHQAKEERFIRRFEFGVTDRPGGEIDECLSEIDEVLDDVGQGGESSDDPDE